MLLVSVYFFREVFESDKRIISNKQSGLFIYIFNYSVYEFEDKLGDNQNSKNIVNIPPNLNRMACQPSPVEHSILFQKISKINTYCASRKNQDKKKLQIVLIFSGFPVSVQIPWLFQLNSNSNYESQLILISFQTNNIITIKKKRTLTLILIYQQ